MSQASIAYIDVRFFAHATEDLDKVLEAVRHVLPSDYLDDIVFEKSSLRGHYGNPITLFETRIKEREIISAFVENLSSRLDELEKEKRVKEIDSQLEKERLYFRLDKQAALQDKFKFRTDDPIHVSLRFKKQRLKIQTRSVENLGC